MCCLSVLLSQKMWVSIVLLTAFSNPTPSESVQTFSFWFVLFFSISNVFRDAAIPFDDSAVHKASVEVGPAEGLLQILGKKWQALENKAKSRKHIFCFLVRNREFSVDLIPKLFLNAKCQNPWDRWGVWTFPWCLLSTSVSAPGQEPIWAGRSVGDVSWV